MIQPPTRRRFMRSLPLLMMAPKLLGQSPQRLSIRGFNHVTLTVSDLKRSIDFYQGLFGFPVQGRQGSATAALRIGSGPQHLGLTSNPSSGDRTPRIDHMCVGIDNFNAERVLKVLASHGVPTAGERGAMKAQVRIRTPEAGGATQGTPEVYVGDPDGIILQLQDPTYCAGSGPLGNMCSAPEPSPKRGLFTIKGYSHCTLFSTNRQRSNQFYQQLFGMGVRSYQGPTAPMLAIGSGVEFLGASDSPSNPAQSRPGSINHFCMNLDAFDPNRCVKALESYGIKPREAQSGPVGPLRHYTTMRMEDRGGAKEGTPELYFTDPDGILVQLQDVSYCGGAGTLGNICPPV
jgi:catechol 2,3-dioxygenase-like lactoylglutathione lyase family enzyme